MDQAAPQLRCVPMGLTLTVPAHTDAADAAQAVADGARILERETGERYPARADVVLPDLQPGAYEMIVSGAQIPEDHQILVLLALIWSRRPWDEVEVSQVIIDARRATVAVCAGHWPHTPAPIGMPIQADTVMWVARNGQVRRTRGADDAVVPHTHLV
ncbi:hypothetical protein [Nocardiopsis aegyptia]|uniref:Uncharacterized protein n=1 Tax=Nocardiopsis aegyptia TaxID=220378 RepID=A0A7Z0EIQ4_9ACTN|nr:hypothetical protein [Nocardiopsis aegyptia]NYJ32827.1 hypothetical protein [Nocardiopsis aegyptia]